MEIVCFGQRRCYSLESKPSTRSSVGGERRKTSGHPSRREQFCGNALVARARLVKLTKKEKRGAFPQCQKGTSDFRDTYDCRESKPIYMYLSGCVSVDEKYGAQQAEKEEKRKRNKDKKKRKKKRRVMDGFLWEDRAGETQPSCSWTQFRVTDDSKKFKYTAFGREESGLS